jgi:hypothetical protein
MNPGFWLQHTYTGAHDVVDVADELENDTGMRPGVVLVPVNAESTLKKLYIEARKGGSVFLDASGWWIDREPKKLNKKSYTWLDAATTRPASVGDWEHWMQQSLDHQMSAALRGNAAAPEIRDEPTPYQQAQQGHAELYDLVDAAKNVTAGATTTPQAWLGVSVDRDFLRQPSHLTVLLNMIVSTPFKGIVFRGFHNQIPPISDARLLEGVRELVNACYDAGKAVFLPNSGWVGWLSMAWGAHGFSGGLSKSSWYDRWPAPMSNPPKTESIFERMLLRHVKVADHAALAMEPGYQACTCPPCTAMAGTYDADRAKRHQIWAAQYESQSLAPLDRSGRHAHIKARVDDAITFRDGLPVSLKSRVAADFLDTWEALL